MAEVLVHSAHSFVIEIGGKRMAAFTECTLPTLEIETEEIKEGGQNTYVHLLPGARKSGRVTLKRGFTVERELMKWYTDVLQGKVKDATKSISIILFDSKSNQLGRWDFTKAYPVKWTGPTLKSDTGAVAIEQLELVVHDWVVT
jgi:phage tail-like protein